MPLVALALPFVTEVWQVYLLVFLLQSASAGFTPTFQATIPDVLTDERDYTNALSLSRLAYDLESLISPMLAAALLTVISFHNLFAGTVFGFLLSAALVITVRLPSPKPTAPRGVWDRTTRGIRLYLATPRLRGLLALNFAVAAAGAMVIVNTVVLVKSGFGLGDPEVALALAAFGAGSMVAALALPRLLERVPDRRAMLTGAGVLAIGMPIGPLAGSLASLIPLWFVLGLGYSLTQTPTGRLLRRSAHAEDRPALFAAQFALSHACWLITYPLAGRLGAAAGPARHLPDPGGAGPSRGPRGVGRSGPHPIRKSLDHTTSRPGLPMIRILGDTPARRTRPSRPRLRHRRPTPGMATACVDGADFRNAQRLSLSLPAGPAEHLSRKNTHSGPPRRPLALPASGRLKIEPATADLPAPPPPSRSLRMRLELACVAGLPSDLWRSRER